MKLKVFSKQGSNYMTGNLEVYLMLFIYFVSTLATLSIVTMGIALYKGFIR